MTDTEARIATHVHALYPDVVADVEAAAEVASDDWPAESTGDSVLVRGSFRRALADAAVLDRLPEVLVSAAETAGGTLRAQPVPAPPYVVVTSLGVILRATFEDARLVVELRAFEQLDGRYRPRESVVVTARLV